MCSKFFSRSRIIILLVFLVISNFLLAQNSVAGKTFSGYAFSDTQNMKYDGTLVIGNVNDDGTFEGQVTWHSLNAIHKISGRVDGYTVIFREIEFIKKGKAVLDCDYALIINGNSLTGRWISMDPKDYGSCEFKRK